MKNLLLVILVVSSLISIYPQQFHSLDGIEDTQGNTFLLYRYGQDYFPFNPIFKLNTSLLDEVQIMQAFYFNYPGSAQAKAVNDFEFFPNDVDNFMNVGFEINPDNHSYIARNDSIVFGGINGFTSVDISNQDPQKIFVFGNADLMVSTDGGFNFNEDTIITNSDFKLISVADFNDQVFFGTDFWGNVLKSENSGSTVTIVDTSKVFADEYFKMLYDYNQFYIYRLNKSYNKYTLNLSNNKGNAFTWSKIYESDHPFYITIDSTQSGVIYLADSRQIYKSTNAGYDFYPYKTLPNKLIGIYKKPNSDIIYAASKTIIFKVTPDSTTIIKALPVPEEEFAWFPLAIGNIWVYNQYWYEDWGGGPPIITFEGTRNMEVTKDTLIENKKYFVVENEDISFMVFPPKMFLRVDSLTGFIYRYWEELNGEYIFHNLNAEVGDTIFNPDLPGSPFYILMNEQPINYLSTNTYERVYWEYLPCSCSHVLVKGFGLARTYFNEFGGSESILKGCVINGVLYGDTTFVVDVEEKQNPIPTDYKLEQNYPNPFNPTTIISYQLPKAGNVTLKVYDVLGREVATLVNEEKSAGIYKIKFNPVSSFRNPASGVYFYQLKAGEFVETKKMLLIK